MSKHTPWPWTVVPHTRLGTKQFEAPRIVGRHPYGDPLGLWVATVEFAAHDSWGGHVEHPAPVDAMEANARLIAAAPELLAALRECGDRLLARMHTDSAEDYNAYSAACAAIAKAEGQR